MKNLKAKIIKTSKERGYAHIGSCISVLPILEKIYLTKGKNDKVILDNAHAHLAHSLFTKIDKLQENGIHCDRKNGCDATGGSLGHALGIAIGMAYANPKIKIHVIVSDGSMMEGSNWEALRIIADNKLDQIVIYCNFNGYTAVSAYDCSVLENRMKVFLPSIKVFYTNNGDGFDGLQGHYRQL